MSSTCSVLDGPLCCWHCSCAAGSSPAATRTRLRISGWRAALPVLAAAGSMPGVLFLRHHVIGLRLEGGSVQALAELDPAAGDKIAPSWMLLLVMASSLFASRARLLRAEGADVVALLRRPRGERDAVIGAVARLAAAGGGVATPRPAWPRGGVCDRTRLAGERGRRGRSELRRGCGLRGVGAELGLDATSAVGRVARDAGRAERALGGRANDLAATAGDRCRASDSAGLLGLDLLVVAAGAAGPAEAVPLWSRPSGCRPCRRGGDGAGGATLRRAAHRDPADARTRVGAGAGAKRCRTFAWRCASARPAGRPASCAGDALTLRWLKSHGRAAGAPLALVRTETRDHAHPGSRSTGMVVVELTVRSTGRWSWSA